MNIIINNASLIIVAGIVAIVIIVWRIIDVIEVYKFAKMEDSKVQIILKNRRNPIKQFAKLIKKAKEKG